MPLLRSRRRAVLKWTGAVISAFIIAGWLATFRWHVHRIEDGSFPFLQLDAGKGAITIQRWTVDPPNPPFPPDFTALPARTVLWQVLEVRPPFRWWFRFERRDLGSFGPGQVGTAAVVRVPLWPFVLLSGRPA